MTRYRLALAVYCALVLALVQGCAGVPPPPLATERPFNTPAVALAITATADVTAVVGVPTPTLVMPPSPGGTAPAPAATPNATASAHPSPRPSPLAAATATEPRFALDPPRTPVRPGPPGGTATPVVRSCGATIRQIQGGGAQSPLLGRTVRTIGVVTADFQGAPLQGFFIQAHGEQSPPPAPCAGEAEPARASSGLFIYQGGREAPDVKVGDAVVVVGVVREFNERTNVDISQMPPGGVTVESSGNQLPPPVDLRSPVADAAARGYYERLEGMLVGVPEALVVGPTNRSGEFIVVRADDGATRPDAGGTGRGGSEGRRIVVDDAGGSDARYELAVGDRVEGLIGPLDWSFDAYKIEQLPTARPLIVPGGRVVSPFAPAGPAEFTVASFNLQGFFDQFDDPARADPCDRDEQGRPCRERLTGAEYARKRTKAGAAIRDALGAPTLVAVQEVENLEVLGALAAGPELAPFGYGAVLLEGFDPRGSDVGLLYRRDRVSIETVGQRNACTTADLGFGGDDAPCSSRGDGRFDGFTLAPRPPLVVALTVRGAGGRATALTLIVADFTTNAAPDPQGREVAGRRVGEARLVAGIVDEILATNPNAAVIVLGDLNDTTASEPLRILTGGATVRLRNLALDVPEPERYSVITEGRSQVLDYILVTPNLRAALVGTGYAHFNADYPESRAADSTFYRVSDHDPPVARFRLEP